MHSVQENVQNKQKIQHRTQDFHRPPHTDAGVTTTGQRRENNVCTNISCRSCVTLSGDVVGRADKSTDAAAQSTELTPC